MSDPKKVNPRFAAIAEELAPPPEKKPRSPVPAVTKIDPPLGGAGVDASYTDGDVAAASAWVLQQIASAYGLFRRDGEGDAELRRRVKAVRAARARDGVFDPARDYASEQLQVAVGREVRREIVDGRPAILFEGFVLVLVHRERMGGATVSSLETYEGWDGRARIRIAIEREEALYEDVYNAGGYVGRIKKW